MTEPKTVKEIWTGRAIILGFVTIFYNLVEGGVSVFFGGGDEALSLFGFGVDSFVEVLSGIGVTHMLFRMRKHPGAEDADRFEQTALRITGAAFYVLAAGLTAGAAISVFHAAKPTTTLPGLVISLISIITMWLLYFAKRRAGKEIGSEAVLSDAECTMTCIRLSVVLLVSSLIYLFFRLPYIDAAGSVVIAWFSFQEGKEAFQKAKRKSLVCHCGGKNCDAGQESQP